MKKLLFAVMAVLGFSAASFAQTTATKAAPVSKMQATKTTVTKVEATKPLAITNKDIKATKTAKTVAAPVAVKTTTTSTTTAAPVKKDGTPDKRFAGNKHLKKDGTKDMRYKTNKGAKKTS